MIRFFDFILSGLAILVLSPLLIPVVFILRITGEGEIFYRQKRVGYKGKEFDLLKFATMLKDSPRLGEGDITVKNDPRVLPFGKFLRKTKVNELPQLLNIFLGDMSIIGPRPLTPKNFNYYNDETKQILYSMRPGLSGIGSIVFRDEESMLNHAENKQKFYMTHIAPYKGSLEVWYYHHQNVYTYFLLIIITAWVVLFPKSNLLHKVFKDLPDVPKTLKGQLK